MNEERRPALGLGPVGLFGCALLVLGILRRSRIVSLLGLAGVVADVTVAGLGGFKAMNEPWTPAARPEES